MHPLLARPARLLLVMLTAAACGVPLAWLLRLSSPRPWAQVLVFTVPLTVVGAFIALSAWWVCRRHPLPAARPWTAVAAQSLAALQSSLLWTALAAIGSVALARTVAPSFTRATILDDLAVVFVVGLPLYLVSAVGHYLALAVEASHEAERRAFETEVTAREAELRALRAQLNPHFLFNSLNSINALIGSDPEGARRMCERLGDFLRRSLALGAREVVTLGEELILVERYLDIEQLRFGARLRVEVEVADVLRECLVPPLLLQPLVENAIEHGIQDLVEGGVVRLEAHGEGERLSITVTNPIDGDAPLRTGEGVGLANVQRRLVAWGEEAANLRADRTPDHFRVALTLPLRRREEAHR
jgi:hypothetical protein